MTMLPGQEQLEQLWRQALSDYRQEALQERLAGRWPDDSNVHERIAYGNEPTFQPGYVGPRYSAPRRRIALLGQNPGEGGDPASVEENREYRDNLEAFARGEMGFDDLNRFVASRLPTWRFFTGKGVFREDSTPRMSLLDEDVRLPIEDVAYLNYFPFKTRRNTPPRATPCWRHVWSTYVTKALALVAPNVIIAMGSWCSSARERELRALAGAPDVVRVQHPSARNRRNLQDSWRPLSTYLRGLA
jgi:hypothetical protein